MEVAVLRGRVPSDQYGSGSGYGYGDGDGYGYGSWSGSGYGDGYGSGYGYGDGYGYGYGSWSGSGYGYGDVISAQPLPVKVTADMLKGACADQVKLFLKLFPDGGTWPDDIEKAKAAGLDLAWAREKLGLIEPMGGTPGDDRG